LFSKGLFSRDGRLWVPHKAKDFAGGSALRDVKTNQISLDSQRVFVLVKEMQNYVNVHPKR
jgi:hypothetical protein